jgi:hypothetical protein
VGNVQFRRLFVNIFTKVIKVVVKNITTTFCINILCLQCVSRIFLVCNKLRLKHVRACGCVHAYATISVFV